MTNKIILGYYYLHENSELIYKSDYPGIIDDFRESDLVKKWWVFYKGDKEQAELIIKEAQELGANKERVEQLAEKWGIVLPEVEMVSVCCGAPEDPDIEGFCSACRDGTGFELVGE